MSANKPSWEIVIDELLQDGWKQFPDSFKSNKTCLAKSFAGYEKCYCNAPKNKQVEIYKHGFAYGYEGGFEVTVCGELPDGEWVNLTCYGLAAASTTKQDLDYKVTELLKTWDFMVKNNKNYGIRTRDEE